MTRTSFLALAALALAAPAARAQIDQSQTSTPDGASNIILGQSFTPTQSSLNFVTLALENFSRTGGTGTGQVDILSGAGYFGAVLGTSQMTALSYYNFADPSASLHATTTFTFTSPVSLTSGSPYTIRFDSLTGSTGLDLTGGNPYARGQAYLGGSAITTDDLYFLEGTQPAPEPSPFAVLAVGALGLGALTLTAKRRAC